MGVIVAEVIPTITVPVVDTPITEVSYVRVCTDGTSSSGITDDKSFDKTLYRVFSMQDDMKVLTDPARARNEFELFVEYAIAKTASTAYDSRFDQLDAFLGTIGVTNDMC